uniref:Uncharacterized protein n=1 Tax=Knipowitschia caucasica TaxID=637954 RepID=A0AAV2L6C9_KNICA
MTAATRLGALRSAPSARRPPLAALRSPPSARSVDFCRVLFSPSLRPPALPLSSASPRPAVPVGLGTPSEAGAKAEKIGNTRAARRTARLEVEEAVSKLSSD